MRFYSFLFISMLLVSCNELQTKSSTLEDKIEVFNAWPDSITLESNSLSQFNDHLSFPTSVNAVSDFLVFTELRDSAKIKIFSLSDYSFLNGFGREGQGPNEFVGITAVIQDSKKEMPYLTFYDWGKKLIAKYDINDLLKNRTDVEPFLKRFVLPPKIIQAHQLFYSENESKIIGFAGMKNGKLFLYNTKKDSVEKYTPFIPNIGYSYEEYMLGELYRGSIAQNPEKKRIIVASRLFKQIELYDYDLNLLNATRLGNNIDISFRKRGSNQDIETSSESKLNYTDLDFNSESIFVYYENRTLQEMNNGVCHNSEIHVYDWQGNPKLKYKLEGCPNFIAYDHINKGFIGVFTILNKDDKNNSTVRYYKL